MWLIIFLVPGWNFPSQVQASEQQNSQGSQKRIHTEVHVFIAEEFDEEREHEEYEQLYPVVHSTQVHGTQGKATGRVSYFTRCRFREEDRAPELPPLNPSPVAAVGGGFTPRRIDVPRRLIPSLVGNPRADPPLTKPGLSGGDSGDDTDSDQPVLYGPDLDFLLFRDVTAWEPARWLPESTALHFYARALFGRFEVFDVQSDLELYSTGLRLAVPLIDAAPFSVAAAVSAGPAYMRTDIGDAVGFESGAGLQAELFIARGLSLRASIDATVFLSEDFLSWGPGVSFGLNVAW